MRSVLVVADDLTGANATAALFARLGLRTRTLAAGSAPPGTDPPETAPPPSGTGSSTPGTGTGAPPSGTPIDVTVVTTGSRRLPAKTAADRVRGVLAALGDDDPPLLVKRVDTTLRGPIGAELAAMLAHRRARCAGRVAALAVPAYPAAGRTTVGGIHLLDGTPLARSPAGRDPANPVRSSRAAELLVAGTTLTAAELHLDTLDRDDDALANALATALDSADVTVADASTDADLDRLAAAAAAVRPRLGDIVAVDSGPFAAAYCGALGITARAARSPVLVVVGTPAETTRVQVEAATRGTGARIHLAGPELSADQLAALAIEAIDGRAPVTGWQVPASGGRARRAPADDARADRAGTDHARTDRAWADRAWAERVPAWLAEATRQVLAARPVAGLLASGGEVAAAVLDALEAHGLDIVTEVQPLVVAGRIIGGPWDRLPVVTKGGLVGDTNAITASVGHLHGMHEALVGTTEAREVLSS